MSFDELAQDAAGTLTGVFGNVFTFERPNEFRSQITAVLRRDVETVDESGQVLLIERTIRIASKDLPFRLKRGDTVCDSETTYTIGRCLTDNGYFVEYEVTT